MLPNLARKGTSSDALHRITDVELTLFDWTGIAPAVYGHQAAPEGASSRIGLVTIHTSSGVTGNAFLGSSFRPVDIDARAVVDVLKPLLIGQDALDRERLHRAMMTRTRAITLRPIGALDVALWDIAGKIAGLPIHRLLGSYRARVPAYASSACLPSVQAYVSEAEAVRAAGYAGYKIHPPADPGQHVAVCAAVRSAVGDDYPLMFDASMAYPYAQALRIGRALERLGYLWYEDPLPVDDVYNYTKLCADLEIPVMATEYSPGGFHGYAPWILMKATDMLRGDVAVKGGITPVVKSAHLADAFHMRYELHHGGNSLNNVANLHVALAIENCDYFEVLLPAGAQKYGLIDDIEIDDDGCVATNDAPGLGANIDFDLVRRKTVTVLR